MNTLISNLPHRFSMSILAVGMSLAILSTASAQDSANRLYQAVNRLQQSLGQGADADDVRARLMISELESESGKGRENLPVSR